MYSQKPYRRPCLQCEAERQMWRCPLRNEFVAPTEHWPHRGRHIPGDEGSNCDPMLNWEVYESASKSTNGRSCSGDQNILQCDKLPKEYNVPAVTLSSAPIGVLNHVIRVEFLCFTISISNWSQVALNWSQWVQIGNSVCVANSI